MGTTGPGWGSRAYSTGRFVSVSCAEMIVAAVKVAPALGGVGTFSWSYGTGNVGLEDEVLAGPRMAEEAPFNPNEVVLAEQFGSDILLIDRSTGKHRVLYGERGVAGGGDRLSEAYSAHFITSGPYTGRVLITERAGEQGVLVSDCTKGPSGPQSKNGHYTPPPFPPRTRKAISLRA